MQPRASIEIEEKSCISQRRITVQRQSAVEVRTEPKRRSPEEFQFVKHRVEAGVARMTLNRPDHNLLNEPMLRELADGIACVAEREDVKLIVLDSACKVFCGGIDVGEYTSERVFQMVDAFHSVFLGILESSKPVICVVNGPAIGGGASSSERTSLRSPVCPRARSSRTCRQARGTGASVSARLVP